MLGRSYQHTMVKVRAKEFKKNSQTTNTIEGFWGMLKRGINGTNISVSHKHLQSCRSRVRVPL